MSNHLMQEFWSNNQELLEFGKWIVDQSNQEKINCYLCDSEEYPQDTFTLSITKDFEAKVCQPCFQNAREETAEVIG